MAKVIVLQHVQCETPGSISDALASRGITAQYIRLFLGEEVPKGLEGASGLVVMGGPMGVYDRREYPFLSDEMKLIEQALQQNKPILGVCLGSQLLAAALGAEVVKGEKKEIGWHPISLTEQAATDPLFKGVVPSFTVYHWHGDIFPLPHGAVPLASSALTRYQAFRYREKAYGLLFHMEVTEGIIREMTSTFASELEEESIDPEEIAGKTKQYLPPLQEVGKTVFGRWAGLVA
ncbi:MAG: gamma-glutamyl-gamma-aminobutyrate hydrolase family protein [Candidatus Manganitrophaceae bacterium]